MEIYTKELPTEKGWYWWRKDETKKGVIVFVYIGNVNDLKVQEVFSFRPCNIYDYGGEWFGPLKEPEKGKKEMDEWLIFTSTNKEKIRLHVSMIVGITPCENVMYGSNILLKNPLSTVAVMEKPDRVWEMYEIALKNFSEKGEKDEQ